MRHALLALLAVILIAGSLGLIVSQDLVTASNIVRHDDDDCDSSGPGSGDCDDDHDDSSHDDHDDDRDDHDDRDHDDREDDFDEDEMAAAAAAANPRGEFEIRIIDEEFTPRTLTVEAGQTITVVNADDDEHTATSTVFDTGELEAGESATITIDTPGTYTYICQFHADMQGEIIVTGAGGAAASPEATPLAPASPAPAASPDTGTEEPAGATVEVDIVDFAFEPSNLAIPPGTTVVWINRGVAPHTVTGSFADSGILDPDQSFSFTFDEPGVFDYVCQLHPQMTGQITVDPDAPPV